MSYYLFCFSSSLPHPTLGRARKQITDVQLLAGVKPSHLAIIQYHSDTYSDCLRDHLILTRFFRFETQGPTLGMHHSSTDSKLVNYYCLRLIFFKLLLEHGH